MRLIKMFGLTAIAAVAAMAFVGASSAMAGSTQVCTNDSGACVEPTTVHFENVDATGKVAKGKLLTNAGITVECNALLAANVTSAGLVTNGPVVLSVTALNYTNCGLCTVKSTELGTLKVLRTGEELGEVVGEKFKVDVNCLGFFKCTYNANGLVGHALGPLLLEKETGLKTLNGHVTYTGAKVNGETAGCPESKLDALFGSLTPLYFRT